jgi:hypothetical protein
MLTLAYPWLFSLLPLPLLLRVLLPGYRHDKTGVVVPFLGRLAALTGQQPSRGAVVARAPWIQHVLLWVVWLCMVRRADRWDGARLAAALERVRRDEKPDRPPVVPALPELNPR